ncbi:MAG: PQQ-dependent sugar dehydrogenase [Deltaproteobacteria bacterium]|nr:PQQ-dependent sugar dehydrogenase [Deltaproteobacteria bacterium]
MKRWVFVLSLGILGTLALLGVLLLRERFSEPPERKQLRLEEVGQASLPTDLQFVPGSPSRAVVLEKQGRAKLLDLRTRTTSPFFEVRVRSHSELGLLGLAFHPEFPSNGRFYVNSTPLEGPMRTEISEWIVLPSQLGVSTPTRARVLLEVEQPYPNHDAGQLAFGPDGFLYIGLGDGGSGGDPQNHAQDPSDFLGSMLRIDVDGAHELPPEGNGFRRGRYGIPDGNPKKDGWPPETYAIGLRNPWRYSFDHLGRLWVADVGQRSFEEVDLVRAGDNLGWKIREGSHCHSERPECSPEGLVDPVFEYGRSLGGSIIGGHVVPPGSGPLSSKYVFGDFVSRRLMALEERDGKLVLVISETHPISPSTFGLGPDGQLYVADIRGGIYRIVPNGGPSD